MATLMSFILDTLQPRLNNPFNRKLFLPVLLDNAKDSSSKPLLPLTASNVDGGEIQGTAGTNLANILAAEWAMQNYGVSGMPDPNDPYPHLAMDTLELDNLQNMTVTSAESNPTPDGYAVTITLALGQYTGIKQGIAMLPLVLQGKYRASQAVCTCADVNPTGCDGRHQTTMHGTGSYTATFTNCQLLAELTVGVNGSGSQRAMQFNLTQVSIQGIDNKPPDVKISNVTLDQDMPMKKAYLDQFVAMLVSPQGKQALFSFINQTLAAPNTLTTMSGVISDKANSLFDDILGTVPPGGLPTDDGSKAATPVDMLVFDRVRAALQNPASGMYAPLLVASYGNPTLEPWQDAQINLPDQTIEGLTYTDISLTNVIVASLSNIVLPVSDAQLQTSTIQASANFGALDGGPTRDVDRDGHTVNMAVPAAPPLSLQFGFSLTQGDLTIAGNVSDLITGLTANLSLTPSGANVDKLTLTLQSLVADVSKMSQTVTVTTNPDDPLTDYMLRGVFESSQFTDALANAINTDLAKQLGSFTTELSNTVRRAITAQLGN